MRVVPIAKANSAISFVSECEEGSSEIPKLDLPITRRNFLQGSGILMGTIASGSLIASFAPSTVWAVELKTLSKEQGETLMAMGKVLFPHKKLPDAVYGLLAKDLDAKASGDPEVARGMVEGINAVNKSAGGNLSKASKAKAYAAVKGLEGTLFFGLVRGQCITSLYDNDMAFVALGYPGACWEKGGYITRGFQDLKWLPNPDAQSSPPPYLG